MNDSTEDNNGSGSPPYYLKDIKPLCSTPHKNCNESLDSVNGEMLHDLSSMSVIDLSEEDHENDESPSKSPWEKKAKLAHSFSRTKGVTKNLEGFFSTHSERPRSLSPAVEDLEDWDDMNMQDETIVEPVKLAAGVKLFSRRPVCELAEIARMCEFETEFDKVSTVRPFVCPDGLESATFLVDLESVNPSDLNHDLYGCWGNNPAGKTSYYRTQGRKIVRADKWRYKWKIQKLRWRHPRSIRNGTEQFVWMIYKATRYAAEQPRWGVICYQWSCEPFSIQPKAHGNAKHRPDMPYFTADKAVTEELKLERRVKSAEEAYYAVKKAKGGAAGVRASCELPSGRRQIYNFSRNMDVPKGKDGIKEEPGYKAAQSLCNDLDFPFACQFHSGVDPDQSDKECFRAFMASVEQMQLLYEACIKRRHYLQVDGTFDVTLGGYLTTLSLRHPAVIHVPCGRESLEPVAFMLHSSRTPRDYAWFAHQIEADLKCRMKSNDPAFVSVWVSDGEPALFEGFQRCSLFDKLQSAHILCELHLKENDRDQMKGRGFSDEQISQVLVDIYGSEHAHPDIPGRRRVSGLVDLSGNEYEDRFHILQHTWDAMVLGGEKRGRNRAAVGSWSEWFQKNRFDKLKLHYSREARLQMARGPVAGRVTNNEAENVNRRLQKATIGSTRRKLTWDATIFKLYQWITTRTMDLKDAIIRSGDFLLTDEFSHLEVPREEWQRLDAVSKSEYLHKLFLTDYSKSAMPISSNSESCPHPALSNSTWKAILEEAEEIGQKSDGVHQLDGDASDLFSVIHGRHQNMVQRARGQYFCNCQNFKLHSSLCSHVLAVSMLKGERAALLADLKAKLQKKVMASVVSESVKASGSKLNSRKRGKGVNAPPVIVQTVPGRGIGVPFSANSLDLPTAAQKFLISKPRPADYQVPYHNDEPFIVVLLQDFWKGSNAKECKHCGVKFSQKTFIPPEDMAFSHKEVYQYPPVGSIGPVPKIQWSWSTQTQRVHLVHASFKCIFARYGSYFHTGLLRISEDTLQNLSVQHRAKMLTHFGIDVEDIVKI